MVSTLDLLIQVTRFRSLAGVITCVLSWARCLNHNALCTGVKMGARECNAGR